MLTTLLGRPSRERFARAVLGSAQKLDATLEITFDEERFRLVTNGRDSHFNLHNVYQEYLQAGPFHRCALVRRYARMITNCTADALPDSFREAQKNLFPRIRESSFHSLARLHFAADGLTGVDTDSRPLTEHLSVELAFDLPDSIVTLSQSTLEGWGVGFDLALDVAQSNLVDVSPPRFESLVPGAYVSAWRDHYDASRLLLVDLIRSLPVKGDPVAMVPHRDLLIVTGSEDPRGLKAMAELTQKAASEARFMTAIPVRLQWTEWVPFELPAGHPHLETFALLRAQSILRDYDEQSELLERLYEQRCDDTFVASYTATRDGGTGRIESYCVWPKGVESLLPRADTVYFYDGGDQIDGEPFGAPWQAVVEVVGELMTKEDLLPERFRVERFPTDRQLGILAERARKDTTVCA